MNTLYRLLLHLYPVNHRSTFGAEMMIVFQQAQAGMRRKGAGARVKFSLRECIGLVRGAVQEQSQALGCSSLWCLFVERSFAMRSYFRFSSTAIFFMALTLVAVVLAISRGQSVILREAGLRPGVEVFFGRLPMGIILFFVMSCAAGVIGWLVVFVIRRSGIHRLSNSETAPTPR